MSIDFIGIGAQKSGTSWAYTCLYEHPEICAPIKEIHFFSRPRFEKGKEWYEAHFTKCAEEKLKGEFSTSYLYSKEAPERIRSLYPNAKIIAILRNPIDRAFSQYRNAIRAGEIKKTMTFQEYSEQEKSVWEQGFYAEQLGRYIKFFPKEQLLILIYEDIRKDPIAFMRRIYEFLSVDPLFVASMVHHEVNVARTPRVVGVDRVIHRVSEFLRKKGLDRFVHFVRTTGLTDTIRRVNTSNEGTTDNIECSEYVHIYKDDIMKLCTLLERDMIKEWLK